MLNDGNFGRVSRYVTLDRFLRDSPTVLDINRVTIDDAIAMLLSGRFDEVFDRKRLLKCLERIAVDFEEKFYGRQICKHCGSLDVRRLYPEPYGKHRYFCNTCKRTFMEFTVIPSHFNDLVIVKIAAGLVNGESVKKIYKELISLLDKARIPDEKTIYDIAERLSTRLFKLNKLLILLREGLQSRRLMIDDLYALAQRGEKFKQKTLEGKTVQVKSKGIPSFYPIAVYDPDTSFLVYLHAAKRRDKANYFYAISEAIQMLRYWPEEVRGDKLACMVNVAEALFPRNHVKLIFEKLKPWEKGELNKIERKIKDIRRSIPKGRKYGSARFLDSLTRLVLINENYLEPRQRLGGKSAALAVGIPYPFRPYNWKLFLAWAKFVIYRFPLMLKASLKDLVEPRLYITSEISLQEPANKDHGKNH